VKRVFSAPIRIGIVVVLGVVAVAGAAVAFASSTAGSDDYVRAVQYVSASSASNRASVKSVVAYCPSGTNVIGGGAGVVGPTLLIGVRSSTPYPATPGDPNSGAGLGTGWQASAQGVSITRWSVQAWAVCADIHGQAPATSTSGSSSGSSGASSGSSGDQSSSGSSG